MENSNTPNALQRIGTLFETISPKQKVLAEYVVKNYESLAYITVAELARLAGVSETTVVRFVYALGYEGFGDFMDALRAEIDKTQKMAASQLNSYNIDEDHYDLPKEAYKAIFALEIKIMEDTMSAIKEDDFALAVEKIASSSDLLIAAWGSNKSHSQAAAFAFEVLHPNIRVVEELTLTEAAILYSLGESSTSLVFSSPRYPRVTQEVLKILKERKTFVIGVSDSILSPVSPYCDILFQVPEKYVTFVDTNAAYMALIHALAFGVYLKNPEHSKRRIARYNSYSKAHGFYLHDFIELINFNRS